MNKEDLNDYAILLLRIGLGLMMIPHGLSKAEMLVSGNEIHFADPFGLGATISLVLTIGAELFCSLLIIIGFKLRYFILPLIITMLVAVFIININNPWSKMEFPMLYLLGYTVLLITGGGKFSVDTYLFKKN